MNPAEYRFTLTPLHGGYPTNVCIQRGTESMTFVTYIQGALGWKKIYAEMLRRIAPLTNGDTFVHWCVYHRMPTMSVHRAEDTYWNRSYKASLKMKEDMTRIGMFPCPEVSG